MQKEKRQQAKKSGDYKKINDAEARKFLERAKIEFTEKCQGFESFFDYLQKEYDCDPVYWVRTARNLGFDIIKRKNKFYLKIEMNDTERN